MHKQVSCVLSFNSLSACSCLSPSFFASFGLLVLSQHQLTPNILIPGDTLIEAESTFQHVHLRGNALLVS